MRLTVSPGGRVEPIDRAPTILHVNADGSFAVNNGFVGADYTVPANRRAIIYTVRVALQELLTVARGTGMNVRLNYTPSGLPVVNSVLMNMNQGDGPGMFQIQQDGPIHLLTGDRLHIDGVVITANPPGGFNSVFHGVEYDE